MNNSIILESYESKVGKREKNVKNLVSLTFYNYCTAFLVRCKQKILGK